MIGKQRILFSLQDYYEQAKCSEKYDNRIRRADHTAILDGSLWH